MNGEGEKVDVKGLNIDVHVRRGLCSVDGDQRTVVVRNLGHLGDWNFHAVKVADMTDRHHLQTVTCVSTRCLKGFHVEGVVRMARNHSVVHALFFLELEPRNEVGIVFTIRG